MKKALFLAYNVGLLTVFVPLAWTPPSADVPHWLPRLVFAVLGLGAWFGTQALIGAKEKLPPEEVRLAGELMTRTDVVLRLSDRMHQALLAHLGWARALLISSSLLIDALGLFLLVQGIFGPSIRPFLGLLLVCGLRQILQGLTTLPPPPTMIWRDPGFPSLLVTYGVANDLFFSGHTAVAVIGVVELARLGHTWLIALAVAIAIYEIGAVLLLRAHYTMDVYAGLVTALLAAVAVDRLAPACDAILIGLLSRPIP